LIVTPQTNGGFTVSELFKGTFVTTGPNTPGFPCKALASGIHGTFYGDFVWSVGPSLFSPAPVAISDPGVCAGSKHFDEAHFGDSTSPCSAADFRWQFHYTDGSGGPGHEWTNAEEAVVKHPTQPSNPESEGNIES
jgi:hypothetical protein